MRKVAAFFFLAMLLCGCQEKAVKDYSVYITENQIIKAGFEEKSGEQVLDEGGVFKTPVIAADGKSIAYKKDDTLFVCIPQKKEVKRVRIAEKTGCYLWRDNAILLYCTADGGIGYYDILQEQGGKYIDNQVMYEDMVIFGDQLYLQERAGIYVFDLTGGNLDLVLASQEMSKETGSLGLYPAIAGLATDGSFLYIWRKPMSASLTADGVLMGAYDTQKKQFLPVDDNTVFALAYKKNVAPFPNLGARIVLNNGFGRGMNENKAIGTVDFEEKNFEPITHPPLVTMTPSFSSDGKTLLFSASPENPNYSEWLQQNKQHIYSVQMKSGDIKEKTNMDSFDFWPLFVKEDKAFVFLRRVGESLSLIYKKGETERVISENLWLNVEYDYYGFYDASKILAIYRPRMDPYMDTASLNEKE